MEADISDTGWMLLMRAADLCRVYGFGEGIQEVQKVTMAQQNVLGVVYSHPGPGVMLKDIAMDLHLTPGAVSQTVEALVRMDAVERVPSPHDRRAVLIRPSPKGMRIREAGMKRITPVMKEVLSEFDVGEREVFVKILGKLVAKMLAANAARQKSKSIRTHKQVLEGVE